ncbi:MULTISPECIES: DUF123 domain-containing protein [unclassified Mesotoga]|jgi:Uri superfamily endonuclease|uniref:GIY-YIG nuclease family protein n=1 Tax=unclassified Mesotoga TaxID=1184398 RepID=UPI000EF1FADD|nr:MULTISPECIES: DUF123 domain-containing protein [unclassified Mesotoga]NLT46692.1 DUF123 domain-containing protein [Thermotogaceae bacterium]MDD4206530.1 DUF123 domain-containing protein [Mesotoga sp.]MDD4825955.1 DUF123 domain-containing protein [Mesotoga sp.]MDD5683243.1 DUF123 domain-containing protein [Mesotoga sp.]RLL87252.1 endonuclease [Mesotoga sp. BH458_6_3_2_1]
MDYNKGDYVVLFFLKEAVVISSLCRSWTLDAGYYMYIGSAMSSLAERVKRHLIEEKRKFWHIDYFREKAEVVAALLLPTEEQREEELSNFVSEYGEAVPKFGASDCSTDSNLYRLESRSIERVFSSIVCKWRDKCDSFFD